MAPTRKPIYSKYQKGYEPRLLRYVDTSPPRNFSAYVEAGMRALLTNVGAAAAFQQAYPSEQAYNEAHNIAPVEEIAVIDHFLQDVTPTEESPDVVEVFLPQPTLEPLRAYRMPCPGLLRPEAFFMPIRPVPRPTNLIIDLTTESEPIVIDLTKD